jgi:hypothetical protein
MSRFPHDVFLHRKSDGIHKLQRTDVHVSAGIRTPISGFTTDPNLDANTSTYPVVYSFTNSVFRTLSLSECYFPTECIVCEAVVVVKRVVGGGAASARAAVARASKLLRSDR